MAFKTPNKKAQTEIIYILLAVVLMIITLAWYNNYREGAKESKEVESCRLTVLQNSEFRVGKLLKKEALGVEIPTPEVAAISCPKRQLVIDNRNLDSYDKVSYGAKYEIANAMRLCWYQWGQGQLQPFDVGWFDTGKRFCAICYEVQFKDDFKQSLKKETKGAAKIENFYQFLTTNKVPDGSTYFANYLTNKNGTFIWPSDLNLQGVTESIDVNRDYSIIYSINKQGLLTSSILGGAGAVGGCVAGSFLPIIGNAIGCGIGFVAFGTGGFILGLSGDEESTVWLIPKEDVRSKANCDLLYQ